MTPITFEQFLGYVVWFLKTYLMIVIPIMFLATIILGVVMFFFIRNRHKEFDILENSRKVARDLNNRRSRM